MKRKKACVRIRGQPTGIISPGFRMDEVCFYTNKLGLGYVGSYNRNMLLATRMDFGEDPLLKGYKFGQNSPENDVKVACFGICCN